MRFWHREEGEWQTVSIDDRLDFDAQGKVLEANDPATLCAATILRTLENRTPCALLVAAPDTRVTVNGYRPLDLVLLRDRDVLTIGSRTFYFAERTPTSPEIVPEGDAELCCGRCKVPVRPGDLAIRCSVCFSWHHVRPEDEKNDCWLYDAACGNCGRHRDELIWEPEDADV